MRRTCAREILEWTLALETETAERIGTYALGSSGSLLPIPAAASSELLLNGAGVIVAMGAESHAIGYVLATVAVAARSRKKRMCDILTEEIKEKS